ncbi:MAG: hypothetical protein ACJAYB_000618 [Psychromonas sp.]|jgi:hypothetical protein
MTLAIYMFGALSGKLYGDKGYLDKALASQLQEKGSDKQVE